MNRIELDALAHCATIVRTDLDHLRELAALPPCDPPAMQSCTDLTNPAWLDAWLRAHPADLAAAITQHEAILARMNARRTQP